MMRITLQPPITVASLDYAARTLVHIFVGRRAVCGFRRPLSEMSYSFSLSRLPRRSRNPHVCKKCWKWLLRREPHK